MWWFVFVMLVRGFAWAVGLVLGFLAVLPRVIMEVTATVFYLISVLSQSGLHYHESLHRKAARAVGASVLVDGWESDTEYQVQTTPISVWQSVIVGFAPLLFSVVAVFCFVAARTYQYWWFWILLTPFILGSVRYSLPSAGDLGAIVNRMVRHSTDPAVVPAGLLVLLFSPVFVRLVHRYLMLVIWVCWGVVLWFVSGYVLMFIQLVSEFIAGGGLPL